MSEYPYISARRGREKQRYDGETRLVVGCVVYRGDEFLLISSHNKPDKWVFPKGGWETDESYSEAAKRETFEEAGVEGVLGECISTVTYQNKLGKPVLWRLYPLKCEKIYDWWPESEHRSRKWVCKDDLAALTICPLTQQHIPKVLEFLSKQ